MNDWYNDPPDHPEPPEWYCNLEAAAEDDQCPAAIATAIRELLASYDAEQAKKWDIDPSWED